MKFFEYLYYRMYEAYNRKNDSPIIRASLYISVFLFVLIILLLVFLERFLLIKNLCTASQINIIKGSYIFWICIFLLLFLITYYGFTKKTYSYYKQRFDKYYHLDKSIKVWLILNLPFFLLFLGLTTNIFLFGGEIFGTEIKGIFGK